MIYQSDYIKKKKVYGEWETKRKLTHLKIILINCFIFEIESSCSKNDLFDI